MASRTNDENKKEDKQPDAQPPKQQEGSGGSNYPEYLRAALKLSASHPLGANRVDSNIFGSLGGVHRPVPGVAVINYVPTLGVSTNVNSALNRAAFYDFNFVRKAISGNRPYQPVDLMIYRICVDGLRDLYDYIARVYKVAQTYSATNYYRPRLVLQAMGLNADDILQNTAQIYMWLTRVRSSLVAFPTVPIGSLTARRSLFNTKFFTDGEPECAQTYIVNQVCFWSYEKVDTVQGVTPRGITTGTWSELETLWNTMFNALQYSSDVAIMAADIRRAYEDRVVTDLTCPGIADTVEYEKLSDVLLAIMNMECAPSTFMNTINTTTLYSKFRIYDDTTGVVGTLKCDPELTASVTATAGGSWVLPAHLNHFNMLSPQPSENDFVCAARMHIVGESTYAYDSADKNVTLTYKVKSCGTEVAVDFKICTLNEVDPSIMETKSLAGALVQTNTNANPGSSTTWYTGIMRNLADLANFDWHPPVVLATLHATTTDLQIKNVDVVEDVQNYVPVSDQQLTDIHNALLLAEFGMPG